MTPEFRRRTLALLEDEMVRNRVREFRPRSTWRRLARPLAEAAAVVVAALGGYFVSHRVPSAPSASVSSAAALPAGFEKAGALSNVSYRPADPQGRIGVTFDVTSRQTVVGRPDDPQMARLVAYLVSRGAQTAGERSRAIELVSSHYGTGETPASPDIVRALTATLKKDQNPGVRKKAADALAGFKMTAEVRAAFLDALRTDVNPGVRLVAVDALAAAAKEVPDAQDDRVAARKGVRPDGERVRSREGRVRSQGHRVLSA